jgi:hypothetical protein
MAEYEVKADEIGVHQKKLTAETVDTITFARAVSAVRIFSDGTAWIYYTTDGSVPVVGANNCHAIPPTPIVDVVDLRRNVPAHTRVIKLISAGTPVYDVSETATS